MNEVYMRKMMMAAALAATGLIAMPAMAQDSSAPPPENTTTPDPVTAPDGSDAFGFEPYFAVMGGYASYDRDLTDDGIPNRLNGSRRKGALVEGLVGANIPLGAFFVGAEGNVAKGVDGTIDWQYGVAGRVGFRAGESGMIYAKAGYEWVNFTDDAVTGGRDFGDEVYGLGVEVGPREIGLGGLTGESGARLRLEVTSRDFETLRPMAGLVFHF
jgi:outer membrane immunogenic protein